MAAAGEAGQVAAAIGVVGQVKEPPRDIKRPPEHMLAAVRAYITGPVYAQAALALGLVLMPVAALGCLPMPALACGHSTFPDMRMAPLRGATSPS